MSRIENRRIPGFPHVPDHYFDEKDARRYRFHIAEDVARAGDNRPRAHDVSMEPKVCGLYEGLSDVSLYVHSPWCVERCTYCYFWGQVDNRREMQRLVQAEQSHARLLDERIGLASKRVRSVYFGGGTPTVLPRDLLRQTLAFFVDRYGRQEGCEVSCEASVSSLKRDKVEVLEGYVNRLSIGVQSFDDRLLGSVHRTFTGEEAKALLRDVIGRFACVNIDLIYGLQTQTPGEWLDSVRTAIELEVPSITLYRLEVRESEPLNETFCRAPESFPGELECHRMRGQAKDELEAAGYRENLVGWFLRPEVEDTTVYRERWQKQSPCLAFGPGVQNYGSNHFYYNLFDKRNYFAALEERRLPIESYYEWSPERELIWFVLAQWKSNRPASLASLEDRFGEGRTAWFLERIRRFVEWQLLTRTEEQLELTESGRSLVEWMLEDLIRAL